MRRRRRRRRRGWILLFPADWEKSVLISHQRKQTISLIEPSRKINEIGPTVERHLKVRKRKKKKQKQKQRKTIIIKRRNEFNDALFSRSKWSATVNKTCQSNPHFKQSEKNNNKEREKEEREREREREKKNRIRNRGSMRIGTGLVLGDTTLLPSLFLSPSFINLLLFLVF